MDYGQKYNKVKEYLDEKEEEYTEKVDKYPEKVIKNILG